MPTYQKIFGSKKLIIFDIDGTLVDTIPMHVEALVEAYQLHGNIPQPNPEIIQKNLGVPAKKYAENVYHEHGVKDVTHVMIQKILDHHFQKLAGKDSIAKPSHVIPGVLELLTKLSKDKKHLAILSGNPKRTGEGILRKTGLAHFFEAHIFADELIDKKPIRQRSQMVQKIVEEMGKKDPSITPETSLMIGDTLHDIEAAKKVRVDSLAVGTGSVSESELKTYYPTYFVSTLKECLK